MIRVYRPDNEHHPDIPNDTAVLMLPPIGSRQLTDGGGDAQHLANQGFTVIGLDRPTFGPSVGTNQDMTIKYSERIQSICEKIYPYLDAEGIDIITVTGRSAGGLAALAVAASGILPVHGVYVAEPAGMKNAKPLGALRYFQNYQGVQSVLNKNPEIFPRLVRPQKSDAEGKDKLLRSVLMPVLFAGDAVSHERLWCSDSGMQYASVIATTMAEISVQIDIAELSLVAPDDDTVEKLRSLSKSRSEQNLGRPFGVEIVPDTTHSSFDNREFFNERLLRFLEKTGKNK